jgi:hypothetical protein
MPSESGVKIVIRADGSQPVNMAKLIGEEMDKTAKKAGEVGKHVDKWGDGLAKAVLAAITIKKAISEVIQGYEQLLQKGKDASRTGGQIALERDQAAARLRLTGTQAQGMAAAGKHSQEENVSFMTALAAQNPYGLHPRQSMKAMELFRTGLYSQSEILEAQQAGRMGQLQKQQATRYNQLSYEAQQELDLRENENISAQDQREIRHRAGVKSRLAEAATGRLEAANPLSAILSKLGGPFKDWITNDVNGERHIRALEANTRATRDQNSRPSLPSGAR